MLKIITLFASLLSINFAALFGAIHPRPNQDKLDYTSQSAQMKLSRAEKILATLVPDPQSYQLILSSNSSFGGAAVPAHVYADKPSIIIYQGALAPNRSNEELAFMMAHELGHLNMHHNEKMNERMDKIFNGPIVGISGTIMTPIYQKFDERQADLFGLSLYKKAGYNLDFFRHTLNIIKINPNLHFGTPLYVKQPTSLSLENSHFSIKDRFELLAQEAHKQTTVNAYNI